MSLLERRRCSLASLKFDAVSAAAAKPGGRVDALEDIARRYDGVERVAQGGLAVVYKAIERSGGQKVALKVVRSSNPHTLAQTRAEFLLLQRIEHPNIVHALDFFVTDHCAVLAMSLVDGIELGIAVRSLESRCLSERMARTLFEALLQALDHLHAHRMVHRDVKPENVMVSQDFSQLQLVDFGSGRYLPEGGCFTPTVTPAYAAPEVCNGGSPTEATDIWGAGLCLLLMMTGHCRVKHGKVHIHGCNISDACEMILRSCLEEQHSMRPAAMTLLQTPWVSDSAAENSEADSSAETLRLPGLPGSSSRSSSWGPQCSSANSYVSRRPMKKRSGSVPDILSKMQLTLLKDGMEPVSPTCSACSTHSTEASFECLNGGDTTPVWS